MRTTPILATLIWTLLVAQFVIGSSETYAQAQGQPAQPENQRPAVPSDDKLMILIMSTLVALHQANTTGNFTVLRELGAPEFQSNSPEKLAQAFADLRQRKVDLSRTLLFQPKLVRRPEINARGMLRITGFFPTSPDRIDFDLIYQPVQGRWRLYGISVNTSHPLSIEVEPEAPKTSKPTQGSAATRSAPQPAGNQADKPREPEPHGEGEREANRDAIFRGHQGPVGKSASLFAGRKARGEKYLESLWPLTAEEASGNYPRFGRRRMRM